MGSWERGTWLWQVPKWQCGYLGWKSVRSFGIGGALRTPSSFSWTPSWITPVSIAVAFPLNYELGSFNNFCSHSGHSTYPRAERTPTRRRESYWFLHLVESALLFCLDISPCLSAAGQRFSVNPVRSNTPLKQTMDRRQATNSTL